MAGIGLLAIENRISRRNSLNADGYYRELEKMHESGVFTTGVSYNAEKSEDFLSLIEKMQGNRLDDQRCEMPERPRNATIIRAQFLITMITLPVVLNDITISLIIIIIIYFVTPILSCISSSPHGLTDGLTE
uniref:Uncharacterized protein n=2 Tax=Caenorhabditis japonica TaxID=281687 RepID=A0A8R1I6F5_CAEJA